MRFDVERQAVRMPFVAGSEVRTGARSQRALLCNLSSEGLFLHLDEPPSEPAEVSFSLPDGGPAVTVRATVKWSDPLGSEAGTPMPVACGLSIVDISERDRQRIERLVERFLSRPTPVLGIDQPRSGLMRVPVITACTLRGSFGTLRGKSCNLGVFGVYVAVEPQPEIGEEVHLEMRLPDAIGPFAKRTTVTWRNPGPEHDQHTLPPGCGLRFEDLGRSELRRLVRLVDQYLARLPRIQG